MTTLSQYYCRRSNGPSLKIDRPLDHQALTYTPIVRIWFFSKRLAWAFVSHPSTHPLIEGWCVCPFCWAPLGQSTHPSAFALSRS